MQSSFPNIPLIPVNAQAARLMADTNSPANFTDTGFTLELQKECDELAEAITRMEKQLASHQGGKTTWFNQCTYNLGVAVKKLKTNRHTITMITRMAAEIAEHKAVAAKAEARSLEMRRASEKDAELTRRAEAESYSKLMGALAKTERHHRNLDETIVFLQGFKKVVKEDLGLDHHLRLIEKTKKLIATGWLPAGS